jgi:RND family efflux transporter MFP subunit
MRRWIIPIVMGVAFLGWLGIRLASALKTKSELAKERQEVAAAAQQAKSAPSSAVPAEPTTWRPQVSLDGTLMPARESDLAFKVGGRLQSVRVKMGDRVRAGQTLASLSRAEAEAQVKSARAAVRAAEVQLALADDAQKRVSALEAGGAASNQMGVQSTQQRELVSAQLQVARANLELAETALSNHSLTAPFAGVVTKVPSGPGGFVAPGAPLFHVQDTQTLRLTGTVGEAEASLVKVVFQAGGTAQGREVSGRITAVLGSVDAATRRVPVEAEVKNDGPQPLLGGTFVRAHVVGLSAVEVVRLPQSALKPGSQNELFVVNGTKLEARRVTASISGDGALLVRTGVSKGERVLVGPSAEAKDGDPVVLK